MLAAGRPQGVTDTCVLCGLCLSLSHGTSLDRVSGHERWKMSSMVHPLSDMQVCSSRFAYVCGPGALAHGDPAVLSLDMANSKIFRHYTGHRGSVLANRVTDHSFLFSGSADGAVHCALLQTGTVVLQFRSYPRQFLASLVAFAASFVQLFSIPFVYDSSPIHSVRPRSCPGRCTRAVAVRRWHALM